MNLQSPSERLNSLKDDLASNRSFIRLNGYFKLTKTEQGWVDALAVRDRALESSVMHWLSERSSYQEIIGRYQAYDNELHSKELPQHYPLKILSGVGSISSGKNIFMFFPNALGLEPQCEQDVFGLEFVDVWSNLFRRSIFDCVKRVFSTEDQLRLLVPLETNLERTIYLSSVFHEIGHRVGPFRVSPGMAPGMNLSEFQVDVFGELATDSHLILNLPEFPEVAAFVILQRLFWFGRRGFSDNPLSAQINHDNDAWIGAYLWQKLTEFGVISSKQGKLRFQSERVVECFTSIIEETDAMARRTQSKSNQDELVSQWMCNQVPCERGRFFLPEGLRDLFGRCHDIPEVPHFQPIFNYSQIQNLKEVSA